MEWKLVKNLKPYEDYITPSEEDNSLVRRYYKQDKKYPILSLSIYSTIDDKNVHETDQGFSIHFSKKIHKQFHWDDFPKIPFELYSELTNMLEEAHQLMKKQISLRNFK